MARTSGLLVRKSGRAGGPSLPTTRRGRAGGLSLPNDEDGVIGRDERLARPWLFFCSPMSSHAIKRPSSMTLPSRKWLRHDVPAWVDPQASVFFITICCEPRGQNHLCKPEVANRLLETVKHRTDGDVWFPHLFLLMPDHLHALLSFHPHGDGMRSVVSSWKGWTAKTLGIKWQRGFFDHRLRTDEHHRDKANYIMLNPVRAGLIDRHEDWPYVWLPG